MPTADATALPFDVLVVGSGLAGLAAALRLAPTHRVALFTKGALDAGASGHAQGGIAAVLADGDSFEAHLADTLDAGAGLCDPRAARFVVENAPATVEWLCAQGVPFTREGGALHLTREGGHSARRIVHATDATGAAVQRTLMAVLARTPGIAVFEQHHLVDVLRGADGRCAGFEALDAASGRLRRFTAPHTVLATGGAGQIYLHTTNPAGATGDGIAAAWRAGCAVSNLEFVQFHPTRLHHPTGGFLISEAVRGEGGLLRLPASAGGARFMPAHDRRAELAPRDIVARAIDTEMKRHGVDSVLLDISHQPAEFLQAHFPNILARCAALGIDITRDAMPVTPAAHYTCGGIQTDLSGQAAGLPGLYAIGEAACTGLHGANRLASNSLLECLVFARAAADAIRAGTAHAPHGMPQDRPGSVPRPGDGPAPDVQRLARLRQSLRETMWRDVGIVRDDAGLARADAAVSAILAEAEALHALSRPTPALLELRNLAQVAALVARSARARTESRGGHYTLDHPATAPVAQPTVLAPAA